jgi:peptide/nickel transport system substrate-binding protein
VLPGSPLYEAHYRTAWADHDPARANALLDDIGLDKRNRQGIRLLPDGRPLEIIVESAGESPMESDLLELIADRWAEIGVKSFTKPSQREVLRNRIFAGEALMTIWFGIENGVPTPGESPAEFTPVRQHSYQWPKWGQYYETEGRAGDAPDTPYAKELMALYKSWMAAGSRAEQREIWQRILEINAEQVYTIGLVTKVPQPVVVRNTLRNVPEQAIFNWDPGAQFGVYRMDSFWFEQPQ